MKQYLYFFFDIACVNISLLLALYLRNDFPLIENPHPYDLLKVMTVTFLTSAVILTFLSTFSGLWRFTSGRDLRNVILSITLIVLLSNSLLFLIDRLEVIPRSVPPIHWALCVLGMCGSRLLARKIFGPIKPKTDNTRHSVLLIGVNHVAELYLEFAARILHGSVVVEGVIDENSELHGRAFHKHRIFGNVEQIPELLENFLVHGIRINQIILTQPMQELSHTAQQTLSGLEETGTVKLVHFNEQISPVHSMAMEPTHPKIVSLHDYQRIPGLYPYVKRGIDILGSLALALLLFPIFVPTFLLVILDVGLPAFFWQQRPGLYGKNFRLYKFRTMRAARRRLDQDRLDHKASDSNRSSIIGKTIRRLRFDEMPQLLNIFTGEMSFIGPRPLLPEDQPKGGEIRLTVRPGITGWAQIHGGDHLTPEQKLVLDQWYIQNMSFWLDVRIIIKTLIVVFAGDKPALDVVEKSRNTLIEFSPAAPLLHTKR